MTYIDKDQCFSLLSMFRGTVLTSLLKSVQIQELLAVTGDGIGLELSHYS